MPSQAKVRPRPIVLALLVVGALCVVFALPFLNRGERGSQAEKYAQTVNTELLEPGVCGIVLDLRTNVWLGHRARIRAG